MNRPYILFGFLSLCALEWGCASEDLDDVAQGPVSYVPAPCGSPDHEMQLGEYLTEADVTFLDRVDALDVSGFPETYDLSNLYKIDQAIVDYMLDEVNVQEVERDALLLAGPLGRSLLLALGTDPAPTLVDFKELRRGLYHFYNCSRNHPATLDDFIKLYGDYKSWPSYMIEESYPKLYPRRLYSDSELGIYVAETIREGEIHETEVLLDGYRNDGALEFLGYLPNGELTNRGEFRAGNALRISAAPYTCMTCHRNQETDDYTVIYPNL